MDASIPGTLFQGIVTPHYAGWPDFMDFHPGQRDIQNNLCHEQTSESGSAGQLSIQTGGHIFEHHTNLKGSLFRFNR